VMAARGSQPRPALLVAANLAVDAVTAEVVAALRADGVGSLLLRGPAISTWLYSEETESPRTYDDLDLLVTPDQEERCAAVLTGLGFYNRSWAFAPGETVEHASEWHRSESRIAVDLHRGLFGVKTDPHTLWREVAAGAERLDVAGDQVDVPSRPARLLIVTLHAAHHGISEPKPLRDLAVAIERADPPLWQEAAALAVRLSAVPSFAAGLLLIPEGVAIAKQLGIADAVDTEAALLAQSPTATAYGFARLAAIPGLRRKAAFLARKLFPTPSFMRHAFPIARRGRIGLAMAYLWRPIWLLAHAGPGLIAWLRARR